MSGRPFRAGLLIGVFWPFLPRDVKRHILVHLQALLSGEEL